MQLLKKHGFILIFWGEPILGDLHYQVMFCISQVLLTTYSLCKWSYNLLLENLMSKMKPQPWPAVKLNVEKIEK